MATKLRKLVTQLSLLKEDSRNQKILKSSDPNKIKDSKKKLEDFKISNQIDTGNGTINILDRNINKIQNILGTPKVVIVCSQLGVPVAVYGGNSVYWEIPHDLPKTTKLNIDGKALYIHRANYILLDSEMIPEESN